MKEAENVIEIKHLKKSFGSNHVLKDISLDVARGENLGVMGKSGTGKSVLIKCIVRLLDPDSGKIKILGQDMLKLEEEQLNEIRKKIGFLFQSSALYDSMTVKENLEFPLRDLKEMKQEEKDALVEEMLENVGLREAIDKMPSELSGGMRKRIGLARTLILKPEIILYDEPTTGLDPITSREISELILKIQDKYKASSIVITHDRECAEIVTNRIMLIDAGEAIAEGSFEEIGKSDNELVKAFFENAQVHNTRSKTRKNEKGDRK